MSTVVPQPRSLRILLDPGAPSRERLPVLISVAAHGVVLGLACWYTAVQLPGNAAVVRDATYAPTDATFSIILSSPRTVAPVAKTPRGMPTKHASGRAPRIARVAPTVDLPGEMPPAAISVSNIFDVGWADPGIPVSSDSTSAVTDINELARAPRFTAFSRPPVLINVSVIRKFLDKHFPRDLRRQGGDVRSIVWLLIDTNGHVLKALVRETSGRPEADSVALAASHRMQFEPAEQAGARVPVWVHQPIRFRVQDY